MVQQNGAFTLMSKAWKSSFDYFKSEKSGIQTFTGSEFQEENC